MLRICFLSVDIFAEAVLQFGMKKAYPTVLHESASQFDTIYFSGGKIGVQIAMSPVSLLEFIHAKTADIVKKA